MNRAQIKLALTVAEITLNEGLPALCKFIDRLASVTKNKSLPTEAEIQSVVHAPDAAKYFKL